MVTDGITAQPTGYELLRLICNSEKISFVRQYPKTFSFSPFDLSAQHILSFCIKNRQSRH